LCMAVYIDYRSLIICTVKYPISHLAMQSAQQNRGHEEEIDTRE